MINSVKETQMKHTRIIAALLALLLLALPLAAQDEEEAPAEELTEIPYFQSEQLFNVPVLTDWTNASDNRTARFELDDLSATIIVDAVRAGSTMAGAEAVLSAELEELPEPDYTDSVNLADGTWEQAIYRAGDTTASALARSDNGRVFVVAFIERDPAADTAMLVVRGADAQASTDPGAGILAALRTLVDADFALQPDETTQVDLPSGAWTRTHYETDEDEEITAFGFVFGNATYTTITTGDPEAKARLADAFNTIFLGFFVTPDNSAFLWLGVVVTLAIIGGLLFSFYWRAASARRDLATIEQLATE